MNIKIKKIDIPEGKVCVHIKKGIVYHNYIILKEHVDFDKKYVIMNEDEAKSFVDNIRKNKISKAKSTTETKTE